CRSYLHGPVLFIHWQMPAAGHDPALKFVAHIFTALFCSFTGRCPQQVMIRPWNVSLTSAAFC
ncbi:hypothetical protein ACK3YP_01775, partial [Aeromonas allosaccharophila]|uniref:hypothetical protein n=1 Tax=Aeromonas allosaccharophila TaxID=656 RepID=UPI003985ECE2